MQKFHRKEEEKTNQFIPQLKSSITEHFSVPRVASTEDTDPLELALWVAFLHSTDS